MAGPNSAQSQQFNEVWQKAVSTQVANLESFYEQLAKAQSNAIAQITALLDEATRVAKQSVAYADQISEQWRKLTVEAARRSADLITPTKA